MTTREKERRDSVLLLLLILLFGFICIILASGWALRFSPRWKLNANMDSKLNPNSEYLNNQSVNVVEPLNSDILTKPAWMDVFLTPGAVFSTRTPQPTNTPTVASTPTRKIDTPTPSATTIITSTTAPIFIPTKTNTPNPGGPTKTPTATNTPVPVVFTNLAITKTDGAVTYTPGNAITYTIIVTNAGPSNATGVSVADTIPAAITGTTINCVTSGTASCGTNASAGNSLSYTGANIPVGAGNFLTITVNGIVSPVTTGNLVNTATVTAGAGQSDPTPGNNSATDTDTSSVQTNLAITKTDGAATYTPGNAITYTIVVSNAGPSNATGASVADAVPAAITGTTINCVASGTASCGTNASAGNSLSYTGVNIPVGAGNFLTITVSGTVNPATVGNLVNTATVTAGAGQTDPALGNNSATDTDTSSVQTNLAITKTDGAATYTPGNSITYTIVVTNAGPSNAIGASVADAIPASITGTTINCVASGTANCGTNASVGNALSFTGVDIPMGGANFVTITVSGTVNPVTTGNLVNTATVTAGVGQTDPVPGNNSATDTDTPNLQTDLTIAKTDGSGTYTAGNAITYTIVVTNAGPSNATGASVADAIPAAITGTTINCVASGTASCGTNASVGNALSFTGVNIPTGGANFLTITVSGTVNPATTGNLVNTATVTAGAGQTDPVPGNNSATDTDTPVYSADLSITKTDNATDYAAGISVQYVITASNAGPGSVTGATVSDTFSANLTGIAWTCSGSGGASCTAGGVGNINDTAANLPAGTSVTYTVNATAVASPTGNLVNTATISIAGATPAGITDPVPGNNSATDTDTLIVPDVTPPEIGASPDGTVYNLTSGGYLTLAVNITVNGDLGTWDFVYYERPAGSGIRLDWMIVQIGDGKNWYTIFYWGDNVADTNTNMDFNILPFPAVAPFPPPEEPDQRDIPTANLYNSTGIAIDLDGVVPAGSYSYIRFFAPAGDTDGHSEIDAIEVLP